MLKSSFRALLAFAVFAPLSAYALADTLYSSTSGSQTSQLTFYGPGEQVPTPTNPSYGDDYYTGYSNILLTGFSFIGGLQNNPADDLAIDFYDRSGNRVASIFPSNTEVQGVGLHTLASSDLSQNGSQGIVVPGNGYVVFSPYTYTTISVGPDGNPVVTPGDPNPVPFTLGFGQPATSGVNDSTLSATVNNSGVLSTGVFATASGANHQIAQFELDGTGFGPQALQGDANADGAVNSVDLNIVLNHLGTTTNLRANGNFDGAPTIDLNDVNIVLNNLGATASGSSVVASLTPANATPEPISATLLLPAAMLLLRRRSRC